MYIYKILYNKHKIYIFINEECINKYKLRDYKDFEKLIKWLIYLKQIMKLIH